MHSIRKDFLISEKESLLWSSKWSTEKKIRISQAINNHWFLDNYSSIDILEFLIWEKWLNKILDLKIELSKRSIEGLALDIDETLSLTSTFWFEKLLSIFWNPENLTASQMAEKYHLCQNVPYWKDNSDIYDLMYQFREDDNFQIEIPLIEWTNHHYNRIHNEIISILSYITVRPDNVSKGTSIWLDNHDFPKADVIHIPHELEYLFWNLWKACVLDILYPNIVWIVDDNPNLIKMLPSRYKWEVFLFNKAETCNFWHINIHISETIEDVIKNIEKLF